MNSLRIVAAACLVNSLWQVPLLFGAAVLAARLLRRHSSLVVHRVWVTALVLQVLLPAVSSCPEPLLRLGARLAGQTHAAVQPSITVTMGTGSPLSTLHVSALILGIVAGVYGMTVLYCAIRLLWGLGRTALLGQGAWAVSPAPEQSLLWEAWRTRFGVLDAILAESKAVRTPLTLGIAPRKVLLPVGLLASLSMDDLRTLLAHECAHMQRHDFAFNMLYEILSLPIAYHPFVRLTRKRLMESREWVCDEIAARAIDGQAVYARSLLRLAHLLVRLQPTPVPHAIGILDANTLERRLMHLTRRSTTTSFLRQTTAFAACTVIALATCTSAWALRTGILAPASQSAGSAATAHISAGVMAGNILTRVNPTYPPEAKAAHIQGAVVLRAVIDADGQIEDLSVLSGPEELRDSAMDAVRQWTYKPYLLNGEPVAVETTITVNYQLND